MRSEAEVQSPSVSGLWLLSVRQSTTGVIPIMAGPPLDISLHFTSPFLHLHISFSCHMHMRTAQDTIGLFCRKNSSSVGERLLRQLKLVSRGDFHFTAPSQRLPDLYYLYCRCSAALLYRTHHTPLSASPPLNSTSPTFYPLHPNTDRYFMITTTTTTTH